MPAVEPIREVRPPAAPATKAMSTIGKSIRITGTVESQEDLAIDGWVSGSITVENHRVVVGEGASILGDLTAQTVKIDGSVTGDVTASEQIDLRATGEVEGDIRAPKICIREGAMIYGRVETVDPVATVEQQFPIAV
jgi:cytoskeletal protein CcmA (bactofilin family)